MPLGGETIDLPHLVGEDYWLHAGMIADGDTQRDDTDQRFRPPAPPACRCTIFRFSRILNLNIQSGGVSREFIKKDSGTADCLFQNLVFLLTELLDGDSRSHISVGECLALIACRRKTSANQVHERLANLA